MVKFQVEHLLAQEAKSLSIKVQLKKMYLLRGTYDPVVFPISDCFFFVYGKLSMHVNVIIYNK